MEDYGLQGQNEESGAERPIGSSSFKPRGHRQRRAVISLGGRMNTFTWDGRYGDNRLYCFFQPAVASQYTSQCILGENGLAVEEDISSLSGKKVHPKG